MTGKERVKRAVLFQSPDSIPRDLPEPWGSDFLHIGSDADPQWKASVQGEDEWGCVWEKDPEGKTMGQVKVHPLIDYSILSTYRFPNYALPIRYEQAKKMIQGNVEERVIT